MKSPRKHPDKVYKEKEEICTKKTTKDIEEDIESKQGNLIGGIEEELETWIYYSLL